MKLRAALLPVLAALLLAACQPPERRTQGDAEGAQAIAVSLLEGPRLGLSPVLVEIEENGPVNGPANGTGSAKVTGASVRVTGDMAHAGMVPIIREAEAIGPGRYLAEDFEFTMAGDWILTADITLPDGSRTMRELRVTVPGRE